jgi:hypothetical protein
VNNAFPSGHARTDRGVGRRDESHPAVAAETQKVLLTILSLSVPFAKYEIRTTCVIPRIKKKKKKQPKQDLSLWCHLLLLLSPRVGAVPPVVVFGAERRNPEIRDRK